MAIGRPIRPPRHARVKPSRLRRLTVYDTR
jgi:hypothetical protein